MSPRAPTGVILIRDRRGGPAADTSGPQSPSRILGPYWCSAIQDRLWTGAALDARSRASQLYLMAKSVTLAFLSTLITACPAVGLARTEPMIVPMLPSRTQSVGLDPVMRTMPVQSG